MKPERLVYTYVSMASHYEKSWGNGTPIEGVERTAATAHRYKIPVTWIVNSESIKLLGERIRAWHDAFGDDVILKCPNYYVDAGRSKDKLKALLEREWEILQDAFPWAVTKVAGSGVVDGEVVGVLEEAGFQGMWGYCWEQEWWDGITNKGAPWGFWYADGDRYKVPKPEGGKLVACEWTARDLHQAYHTSSPVIYSTDPNDVLRAGLCTGEDIAYWKKLFGDYLRNTASNEQVYFLQHQEAHEMEFTSSYAVWPIADIEATDRMQALFFEHIRQFPITITTLPQAIKLYHEQNRETAPVYMLTQDPEIRPGQNAYTMTLGGVGLGPWPDTFFYYDKECQMAFLRGENKPRMLRNYVGQWDMNDDFEEAVPPVFVTKYEKRADAIEIVYEIGHWKPMPFGLTYWDALDEYEISGAEGIVDAKIIEGQLAFFRIQLTGEKKRIAVTLRRQEVLG